MYQFLIKGVIDMDQSGKSHPRFFGYGSLVNRATHDYPKARPLRVSGWARTWAHTTLREVAFLTAVRNPKGAIDGLSADVPFGDWAALDKREYAYERLVLEEHHNTAIYAVPEGQHGDASTAHPILLSYLDVVVQGYLREFGETGGAMFFATTHGWDAPILDDRSAPIYPRHQVLTRPETQFVDEALHALDCRIMRA